jgi:hypothetical protein
VLALPANGDALLHHPWIIRFEKAVGASTCHARHLVVPGAGTTGESQQHECRPAPREGHGVVRSPQTRALKFQARSRRRSRQKHSARRGHDIDRCHERETGTDSVGHGGSGQPSHVSSTGIVRAHWFIGWSADVPASARGCGREPGRRQPNGCDPEANQGARIPAKAGPFRQLMNVGHYAVARHPRGIRPAMRASLRIQENPGAGGGTRTHTTLPSRDFKSLASTSSATSAY